MEGGISRLRSLLPFEEPVEDREKGGKDDMVLLKCDRGDELFPINVHDDVMLQTSECCCCCWMNGWNSECLFENLLCEHKGCVLLVREMVFLSSQNSGCKMNERADEVL
jgi:hypothetical protein